MTRLSVKAWRKARGLTQKQMADRMGVTRSTYTAWEKNPGRLTIRKAQAVADVLAVNFNDIIFLSNNSTKC